ncbi:hypothetical protein ACFY8F_04870 [Streptomyces tanashiensis]|uniref:hypothetical protein n=1 Tax=Streptomyces tanashiensis TaxID=67367 RepID=UPI0036C1D7D2
MSGTDPLSDFTALGDRLEAAWRFRDYSEDAFPGICAEELDRTTALDGFDPFEFAAEAACTPELPRQEDIRAEFGQPPLTVYRTDRFYITLLYWQTSTTSVHEHGFQGAFRVASGASLHSAWRFDRTSEVSRHLLIGEVERTSSELLTVGDVRPIRPGAAGAHALFHLDHPSVTLVARTHADPRAQPQYEYHPPSLAVDPFFVDPTMSRRIQLLRLLRRDEQRYRQCMCASLETADLLSAVTLMFEACRTNVDDAFMSDLLAVVARQYPAAGEPLRSACREAVHELQLTALRQRVLDPGARLVLALVLNDLDRETSLRLFGRRRPGDPVAAMADAIGTLLSEGEGIHVVEPIPEILRSLLRGEAANDAPEPSAGGFEAASVRTISAVLAGSPLIRKLLRPATV